MCFLSTGWVCSADHTARYSVPLPNSASSAAGQPRQPAARVNCQAFSNLSCRSQQPPPRPPATALVRWPPLPLTLCAAPACSALGFPPARPACQQCSAADFDDRVLHLLSTVPPADGVGCLSKLESALRIPGSVRSPSAYLAGVVKRVAGHPGGGAPAGGGPQHGPPAGAGGLPQLAPSAAQALEGLYASGRLRPGELEGRSLAQVAAMPPGVQAFVMHTFADRNLAGVRNIQGGWEGRALSVRVGGSCSQSHKWRRRRQQQPATATESACLGLCLPGPPHTGCPQCVRSHGSNGDATTRGACKERASCCQLLAF